MASSRFMVFGVLVTLAVVSVQIANGDVFGAISGTLSCPSKIAEDCEYKQSTDLDENDKRAKCCTYAKYERCVQNSAEKHCPGSPVSGLVNAVASADSGACGDYTFWSPECIYSNYFLLLIGTTTGLIVLGVAACLFCYCCCRK
ncbi:hypothetical protein HDE_04874 [Halotydeus destructor]|nr:hypothetical protein HDE_04874 [Halotydeus destructor]